MSESLGNFVRFYKYLEVNPARLFRFFSHVEPVAVDVDVVLPLTALQRQLLDEKQARENEHAARLAEADARVRLPPFHSFHTSHSSTSPDGEQVIDLRPR